MRHHLHNDVALMALQQGREGGFNHFFRLHYSALRYFALSILKEDSLVEEITDDAFVKLWDRRESFTTPEGLKSFLYVTVRNGCIDALRKAKRQQAAKAQLLYLSETSEASIQQQIIRAEVYSQLHAALQDLSPQCRQVFQLFYFQDKSYAEIAQIMGLSINTIRNHKARALGLLRKNFKECLPLLLVHLTQAGCS